MNTKDVGNISQACVVAALLKAGYNVCIPVGDNCRYDLVIEKDGVFKRVQCKTGAYSNGVIRFPVRSTSGGGERQSYKGQIEAFGVYCFSTDKCYLVPIDEVGDDYCTLRVTLSKNGQDSKIRYANEYMISPVYFVEKTV